MRKLFMLLFLAITFIQGNMFAQRNFRIKEGANKTYIVPPGVNLRFTCKKKVLKKKFSYFYIRLRDLNGIYENDMGKLKKSVSWNGKVDKVAVEIATGNACCYCSDSTQAFKWNFLDNRGTDFFLQIDFNKLDTGNVNENFSLMINKLIESLAVLEADKSCDCAQSIKFASGFSQQLVKHLREKIPVPVDLAQPGSCFTAVKDQSYMMLLDEDIILKVDDSQKIETPSGNDKKFRYEWAGSKYFSFKRAPNGSIRQNGFATFDNVLPTNEFQTNVYNIASFADIESSEALKAIRYIALYHPPLKRNNNHSSTVSLGMYSVKDDTNILEGNAFLLHLRSSDLTAQNFGQKHGDNDTLTKSFFSGRGSIAPMIKVYINGEEKIEDFNTDASAISELPKKFNLYRKHGVNYRKVRGEKNKLTLLPNDHLTYKL